MEKVSLVGSNSSSEKASQEADGNPLKKKRSLDAWDDSDVSSSVSSGPMVENNIGATIDYVEVRAKKLLEMGCSSEQVAHAIRVCGRNTTLEEMIDFIQGTFYHSLNEGSTSKTFLEKDITRQLEDMGFSKEHIDAALKACGKESNIDEIIEFIQAHQCAEDWSLPIRNECVEPKGYTSMDLTAQRDVQTSLKDMGFRAEYIQAASKACGKDSSDFELVDYIQAHYQIEDPSCSMENKVNSFDDEDNSGLTPFQDLITMGFSSSSIINAMETCESLDLDDLLSFLLESDSLHEENLEVEENDKETWANGSKLPADEAGPSGTLSTQLNWTNDRIRLWYTYLGRRQDQFTESHECEKKKVREKGSKMQRDQKKVCEPNLQGELSKTFRPEKMMGFGTPGHSIDRPKPLSSMMVGPPFFYFENVAGAPKSEWDTIKRHLYDIDIEFTDSKFFSASRRPRGYVHNLPVQGRRLILHEPPMTIFEALPDTRKYWPWWDTREKLNCINTRRANDKLCQFIRSFFVQYEGMEMPTHRQQEIIQACRKWNLVWVGPGQAAPLEPNEIELLLGFDRDHTRGCSSLTDRYVALGNSFQINTVAYHLSPLKDLYPQGLTVLSLFSGIGGAEVALDKLGIKLKVVVAVEKHIKTRNILLSWWKKTGQRGQLIPMDDVRDLTYEVLAKVIDEVGKFDLIIGGSPCNNLSGCNRVTRTGLSGKESALFFEFPRILTLVKQIMTNRGYM